MGDPERLRRTIAAIDAANADDPNRLHVRGEVRAKELAHAELASEWVERLCPDAADALRIAARAHHLRRWVIPRAEYPSGRVGYHRWRTALQDLHAREVGEILAREGYDAPTVQRVQDLVRKKGLGRDPEVQVLEDALCLVFIETQLEAMVGRLESDRLADVLRKTLRKMSQGAIERAAELPLGAEARALLARATRDALD